MPQFQLSVVILK